MHEFECLRHDVVSVKHYTAYGTSNGTCKKVRFSDAKMIQLENPTYRNVLKQLERRGSCVVSVNRGCASQPSVCGCNEVVVPNAKVLPVISTS